MSANPLLFMPFLHKELCPDALPPSLLQLWPGLPNPRQGFHVPADFPLTPLDAAYYAELAQGISIAAGDNMPAHSLLAAEKQTLHLGLRKELRDISAFAHGGRTETAAAYHMKEARLAAQKALLNVWVLEESHMEIQELEERCRTLSSRFAAVLGVDQEDEDQALLQTQTAQRLDSTAGPSVPWRFVLENAALFLPEHSGLLFSDKTICAELRDIMETRTKVQAGLYLSEARPPTRPPEFAEAPLWKAFGMKGSRPERPWLSKQFSFILWDDAW